MKKIVLLFIAGFTLNVGFLQASQPYTILWQKYPYADTTGQEGLEGIYISEIESFRGASYPESKLVPVYTGLIPFNGYKSNYRLKIDRLMYIPLETAYANDPSFLSHLADTVILSSTIKYIRKKPFVHFEVLPLRINPNTKKVEKVVAFNIEVESTPVLKNKIEEASGRFVEQSVLSSGNWYKIKLYKDGVYKLTYEDLEKIGVSDPGKLSVYGNVGGMLSFIYSGEQPDDLEQIPVKKVDGGDGQFGKGDYYLFYARGPHRAYYDETAGVFRSHNHLYSYASYLFLTDSKPQKLIETKTAVSGNPDLQVTTFPDYRFHELDTVNLLKSGREWWGENFDEILTHEFNFSFENMILSRPVNINMELAARAALSSSFDIRLNGSLLDNVKINQATVTSSTSRYTNEEQPSYEVSVNSGELDLSIKYNKSTSSAVGWLNYIEVNAHRELKMVNDQMHFRSVESLGTDRIARYTLSNTDNDVEIWDVSDIHETGIINASRSGGNMQFNEQTLQLHEFIAYRKSGSFLKPVLEGDGLGKIENQNLHGMTIPDYVIITHSSFREAADSLADFHRQNSKLDVLVVDQEHIFNEFSSGARDVSAIRNFMKMLYDRAATEDEIPRYLLLFGDGTYDNINLNPKNTNFILTYQSENSQNPTKSFVSDDFFGILDNEEDVITGMVDIGVGRFPVKNQEEAFGMVAKVIDYHKNNNMGDWRNVICFIGDDEDNNLHMRQADNLALILKQNFPQFTLEKIYLDAYKQQATAQGERYPDVNKAILDKIKKGALIINYTGHGSEYGLAHERIIEKADIRNLENDIYPVFMTATCEFSRYDDIKTTTTGDFEDLTSAGEYLVINDKGGAVSSFTTTRVVYASDNFELNTNFYDVVFYLSDEGNKYRLGDVMRLTKNKTSTGTNKRNFSLLGDPAIELAFPLNRVVTDSINGMDAASVTDTIGALSKVSMSGHIKGLDGSIMEDFNGVVYPTIFDKPAYITTLSNNGDDPFEFELQSNILYRGKAEVKNGRFNFDFIVPKDISYRVGQGKISYYAENRQIDANGGESGIYIGGSSEDIITDVEGPQIKLYMNDSNFISGGITDENPVILAYLEDLTGINTVGNGIGHDIVAVLDDDFAQLYVLNDFYEASLNDYQKGTIRYPLRNLEEGMHTLGLKVWDINNNSSEAEIEFEVIYNTSFTVEKVYNNPNPFRDQTAFYFEHNMPDTEFDVRIQVYSLSGQLVGQLDESIYAGGFRSPPIYWNGLNKAYGTLSKGIYFYTMRIKSDEGTIEKHAKLMIF